ncbi:MAG TPA: hypothetical protein PLP23_17645 [Panacibacter sp.]|nr:hypothetical protein [Panacibacter sp.]
MPRISYKENYLEFTQDKLREAIYFYQTFKKQILVGCESSSLEKRINSLFNARYNLTAFVNSFRSVTFCMQKELRTKFGDTFEKWYKEYGYELFNHEFSKVIIEMRNINQKHGNTFPIYCFSGENGNYELIAKIKMTNPDDPFASIEVRRKETINAETLRFDVQDNGKDISIDSNYQDILFAEAIPYSFSLIDKSFKNLEMKLAHLIVPLKQNEIKVDLFLKNCENLMLLLKTFVNAATLHFNKIGNLPNSIEKNGSNFQF